MVWKCGTHLLPSFHSATPGAFLALPLNSLVPKPLCACFFIFKMDITEPNMYIYIYCIYICVYSYMACAKQCHAPCMNTHIYP